MKGLGILAAAALAGGALAASNCHSATPAAAAPTARATIESRSGSTATGKAVFTELPSGRVTTEIWIENAAPGIHGLHIHEKGDCSAPDATSAGAHFNASGNPHASPVDTARHNGDLGNIDVGADGKGHLLLTTDLMTVKPGPNSVVGKAVIFHEKADDLKTQPTGNAGARFGCGVVK